MLCEETFNGMCKADVFFVKRTSHDLHSLFTFSARDLSAWSIKFAVDALPSCKI
jgi:hypothetical protein